MYTTVGRRSTLGIDCCDHEHETHDEAQRCLLDHQNEMRKAKKVSTRMIIEVESIEQVYEESEVY